MDSETVWRALASPHRRQIMDLLRDGPRTTGQLNKSMPDLSRFAVMQHLGVLEEAGLVLFRREGRQRFNFLNAVPLRTIYERWVEPLSSSAAATALQMKRYAETAAPPDTGVKDDEEVLMDSSFRHVRIEQEMRIEAPIERVFDAITKELGNWWPHRYKPDSEVFYESEIGGKLGERFKNGGGAIYGEVVYFDPPNKVITSGASSLNKGTQGFNVEKLEAIEGGTIYRKELHLWGDVPAEVEQMFTEGVKALMEQALKGYVERGIRYSAEGKE
jgi:DNA-binding transcriptional ArsR family regulator